MNRIFTYLFLALCSFSTAIYAGGFQLNEHGAKAVAMGGAFTAVADDPSAVYWNGAGLTYLRGTHFMVGTHLIAPSSSFRGVLPNVDNYKMQSQIFFPSHLFASHSISDDWAIGFGVTAPFGLGTKWDEDWIGRYLAIETELQVFTVSPVVAWKPIDQISVSAAFVYSFANVLITRKNPQTPFAGDAFVRLEGDDFSAFGYNLGLMIKPIEAVSIGVSFHSEISYEFEGTAKTTGAQQLIDAKQLPNGDVTAGLTTPFNLAGGIAVDVTKELKLSADFQYVGWSSYDSLKVNFVDPDYTDLASPRSYDDSYYIRLGGRYQFEELALLGGIYFDKNPVEPQYVNPSLPDSDRLGFSIGVDAKLSESLAIQGSYLFIRAKELKVDNSREVFTSGDSPFNGYYTSSAHVLSISLLYSL